MRITSTIVVVLPLALYGWTLAPDVTFIDAGELAAVATTLGIAHPTGYPLFTLIGRLLTALPLPLSPIVLLAACSAACVATGLYVLSLGLRLVVRAAGYEGWAVELGILGGCLSLAVALTVWQQAVVVEVYGLGFLFVALLWLLGLRAGRDGDADGCPDSDGRGAILLAYVAGLAVSNHGSAAPLVPAFAVPLLRRWGLGGWAASGLALAAGIAILALPVHRVAGATLLVLAVAALLVTGGGRRHWRTQVAMTVAAACGLGVYLYLPLRSALDPALDWGDPEGLSAFLRHVSGKVYHVWFLTSWHTTLAQLAGFGRQIMGEMTPLAVPVMVGGFIILWRRHAELARMTALVALLNLLYATNYDIHDIASYFLPTITMCGVWIAVFLAAGTERLLGAAAPGTARAAAAIALVSILPLVAGAVNFSDASQRDNLLVRDYTDALLDELEPDAVLLTRQWDNFYAAAIYDQLVRGRRPDVTLVERELMRRSWYHAQLARHDPELVGPCRELFASFDEALAPFERGDVHDAARLQALFVEVINCLLDSAEASGRPLYLTPDARSGEPSLAARYAAVPVGLAMRLYRSLPDSLPPYELPRVRGIAAAAAAEAPMPRQLAQLTLEMITRRAILEATRGRFDRSRALLAEVFAIDPRYENARLLEQRLETAEALDGLARPEGDGTR